MTIFASDTSLRTAPSAADNRRHLDLRLTQATGTRDQLEHQLDNLRLELRNEIAARGRSHPVVVDLMQRINAIAPDWRQANEAVRIARTLIYEASHAPD